MPGLTINKALNRAEKLLRDNGIDTSRLDAEVLLGFVLGLSRTGLYVRADDIVSERDWEKFTRLLERRAKREPVAYITGEKEFMSLLFKVNRDVLIPRPETEILVEEAVKLCPKRAIDIGTGSGAIAVSLAYYLPEAHVFAVDNSLAALDIAFENAYQYKVHHRISFVHGELLEPFSSAEFNDSFDVIAANLPYIPTGEINSLPEDVLGYEPLSALDGGIDGIFFYREMIPRAVELINPDGCILIEIGYDQAVTVKAFLENIGIKKSEVIKDLAGKDRVIKITKI